jgi:hypothetical protein
MIALGDPHGYTLSAITVGEASKEERPWSSRPEIA